MPRAAWLAVGAAAGALGLGVAPPTAVAAAGLAVVAFALSIALVRRGPRGLLPLAIGVVLIALRGVVAAPAPAQRPLPSGEGPWVGAVESIGAIRDGSRPAVVRLQLARPLLVAASLPWYPPVNPGDRVRLEGRIRPPPDDDYGAYLARIGATGTMRASSLELLPSEGSLAATLVSLRLGAADGIARAIPEPESGLAAGVLI